MYSMVSYLVSGLRHLKNMHLDWMLHLGELYGLTTTLICINTFSITFYYYVASTQEDSII